MQISRLGEAEYLLRVVHVCSLVPAIAYIIFKTFAFLKRKYKMHSESLQELKLKENCETLMRLLLEVDLFKSGFRLETFKAMKEMHMGDKKRCRMLLTLFGKGTQSNAESIRTFSD